MVTGVRRRRAKRDTEKNYPQRQFIKKEQIPATVMGSRGSVSLFGRVFLAFAMVVLLLGGLGCNVDAALPLQETGTPSLYAQLTSTRWAWGSDYRRTDLTPVANANPHPEPQPDRDHPSAVVVSADGTKAYVALAGNELEPGHEVAVFDIQKRQVLRRIRVGSRPSTLVLHPWGRFLVVLNRFSNYASVIDTTLDEVVSEIPLDFYCMDLVWDPSGKAAYVSNRYLNQVLVLKVAVEGDSFLAEVRPRGGFDEPAFVAKKLGKENLHEVMVRSCGDAGCHRRTRGGFYAGEDAQEALFSAIENSTPGAPEESLLLQAVLSVGEGGFADDLARKNFHAGGVVVWKRSDADFKRVVAWIEKARVGPGIPVGNFGSKPGKMALSRDAKTLYVGNQGTQDISIIDLEKGEEVTGIYTQNIVFDLGIVREEVGERDWLIASSPGLGFGAPKERDPHGGESADPTNPAAQYTLLRDPDTTETFPLAEQKILGTFDGIDNTAAFKMGDIQSDLIAVDLGKLRVPPPSERGQLNYALLANRYEAHRGWVRYTSDSAEILPQDISGDIPPDLQRVIGAFPESMAVSGDRVYVAMLGTYELIEWRLDAQPDEASDVLTPVARYSTGIMPIDVAAGPKGTAAEGLVFVANFLGETLSVIDTRTGASVEHAVGNLSRPFPDSDAERGEMFVTTMAFSVDQDTGCTSCHPYGTGDGRGWGAGQAIAQMADGMMVSGGMLAIPQIKNLFTTQPFYFEGTHTAFDAQFDDAREHMALQGFLEPNTHGDFTKIMHPKPMEEREQEYEEMQDKMSTADWGKSNDDLRERRDQLFQQLSMRYFGKAHTFRDLQRFIGEYQAAEPRLMPNPYDARNPSVLRGEMLFSDLGVGCVVCHKPPDFTNKEESLSNNVNRVLPSLITFTDRELSFTLASPHWMDTINGYQRDLEPWEEGRVERDQGAVTTFPLRGIFDRPFSFLHHGRAISVRETFASPNHYSLRKYRYSPLRGGEEIRVDGRERGFNELSFLGERTYMEDTHGATSHLNVRQVQDLENFLLSIE